MSMSPLLFRRSLHGRAGLVLSSALSQLVVARSDRATFFTLIQCLRARACTLGGRGVGRPSSRALAKVRGESCEGLRIQNDSGLPQGLAGHLAAG